MFIFLSLCLSMIFIYACVEGELHLKTLPKIFCDNYICFAIIKKGEIVGPKAIIPVILMIAKHI